MARISDTPEFKGMTWVILVLDNSRSRDRGEPRWRKLAKAHVPTAQEKMIVASYLNNHVHYSPSPQLGNQDSQIMNQHEDTFAGIDGGRSNAIVTVVL